MLFVSDGDDIGRYFLSFFSFLASMMIFEGFMSTYTNAFDMICPVT